MAIASAETATATVDLVSNALELTPPRGWTLADAAPAIRVRLIAPKGRELWTNSARSPLPRVDRVRRVEVDANFKACREDVCRSFWVHGLASGPRTAYRIALHEKARMGRFARQIDKKLVGVADDSGTDPYLTAVRAEPRRALADAEFRALARGVPLLVVTAYEGCAPCHALADEVLFDRHGSQRLQDIEWVLVNPEGLNADWDLEVAPTLLYVDGERVLSRTEGYRSPQQFLDWVQSHDPR